MKQWISLLLTVLLLCTPAAALEQPSEEELSIGAPSAILIERETGTVLYEKNADERLSPASVTKIMTLLLIFEQLDSGRLSTDTVVTASTNACAMLAEGDANDRPDITVLGKLPLFNPDGTPKA